MSVPADTIPYYVDGAYGRNSVPSTDNSYFGPFLKPGTTGTWYGIVENFWAFTAPSPLPPPPSKSFSIYKSVDDGKHWSRIVSQVYNGVLDSYYPGAGNIIYFAYCDITNPTSYNPVDIIKLVTFDMSTDTFGTILASTDPIAWIGVATGYTPFKLFLLSSGDQIIIYTKPTTFEGSDTKLYWAQASGGAWLSFDNALNDSGTASIGYPYYIDNCFIDTNDRIHIFGVVGKSGGYPDTFYSNLYSGIQSSVQIIYTSPTFLNYPNRVGPGVYYSDDDSIEVPFSRSILDGDALTQVSLLRGEPSSNPTFDFFVNVSPSLTYPRTYGSAKLLTNSAKTIRYMLWFRTVGGGRPLIEYSVNDGSGWSIPTTYYGQTVSNNVPAPPALSITGPGNTQSFSANLLDNTPRFGLWILLSVHFNDVSYVGNSYEHVTLPSISTPLNISIGDSFSLSDSGSPLDSLLVATQSFFPSDCGKGNLIVEADDIPVNPGLGPGCGGGAIVVEAD